MNLVIPNLDAVSTVIKPSEDIETSSGVISLSVRVCSTVLIVYPEPGKAHKALSVVAAETENYLVAPN